MSHIYESDLQRAMAVRSILSARPLEKTAGPFRLPKSLLLGSGSGVGAAAGQAAQEGAKQGKRKAKMSVGRWALTVLGLAALGTGLGAGQQLAGHGVGRVMDKMRKNRMGTDYQAMLKADPSLDNTPHTQAYFRVLHRASPYLASEPVIAAATVRSMVDSAAIDERKVKSILDTERAAQETRYPFLRKVTDSGKMIAMPPFPG